MKENDLNFINNEFLRQFEHETLDGKISIEYQDQGRQLFLTKLNNPDQVKLEVVEAFLAEVLESYRDTRIKLMPTSTEIAKFFKKHRQKYKDLLPPGINI